MRKRSGEQAARAFIAVSTVRAVINNEKEKATAEKVVREKRWFEGRASGMAEALDLLEPVIKDNFSTVLKD